MFQISRLRDAEISNGNLINADDLDAEFNQLYSESNSQDTRLTNIESNDITLAGVKTFSSVPKTNGISERTANGGISFGGFIKITPTTQPYVPTANGEFGYDSTNHKYKGMVNGAVVEFGGAIATISSKSSTYTALAGDKATLFLCTSTFILSLTAAATLGSGWFCYVRNDGTGLITLDPNSSETINGATTLVLTPGASCTVVCDGSNFKTMGLPLINSSFTSSQQTITAAGTLTLAHGLGVRPKFVQLSLVCQTGELNYSAGDEVIMNNMISSDGTAVGRGAACVVDATNLTIRYADNASTFQVCNKTTGIPSAITNANWRAVWRAFV